MKSYDEFMRGLFERTHERNVLSRQAFDAVEMMLAEMCPHDGKRSCPLCRGLERDDDG